MKLSRKATLRLNDLIDALVPPAIRDSKAFGAAARRMYGELPIDIVNFKQRAHYLSRDEYSAFYQNLISRVDQGRTDLTTESEAGVIDAVEGELLLDVAVGRGYLAEKLAASGRTVIGCDVSISDLIRPTAGLHVAAANLEHLPFADDTFDTVISTHTLEHVQNLVPAIDELRRVASGKIIIVVPRQRPYQITFNPHIHFFPYEFSWLAFTGTKRPHTLDLVGGDWLYTEDQRSPEVS